MNPRFVRPLSKAALELVKKTYKGDNQRIHGLVSNVVDALQGYDNWAHDAAQSVDLHGHEHDRMLIIDELAERLTKLHNAMGLPNSAIDALPADMLITYCIGLLAQHFT